MDLKNIVSSLLVLDENKNAQQLMTNNLVVIGANAAIASIKFMDLYLPPNKCATWMNSNCMGNLLVAGISFVIVLILAVSSVVWSFKEKKPEELKKSAIVVVHEFIVCLGVYNLVLMGVYTSGTKLDSSFYIGVLSSFVDLRKNLNTVHNSGPSSEGPDIVVDDVDDSDYPYDQIKRILRMTRDREPAVRTSAVCSLGELLVNRPKSITPAVLASVDRLLHDANPQVRCAAVEAFGKLCQLRPEAITPKTVSAVQEMLLPQGDSLGRGDRETRLAALAAYARMLTTQPAVINESSVSLIEAQLLSREFDSAILAKAAQALSKVLAAKPEMILAQHIGLLTWVLHKQDNDGVCVETIAALQTLLLHAPANSVSAAHQTKPDSNQPVRTYLFAAIIALIWQPWAMFSGLSDLACGAWIRIKAAAWTLFFRSPRIHYGISASVLAELPPPVEVLASFSAARPAVQQRAFLAIGQIALNRSDLITNSVYKMLVARLKTARAPLRLTLLETFDLCFLSRPPNLHDPASPILRMLYLGSDRQQRANGFNALQKLLVRWPEAVTQELFDRPPAQWHTNESEGNVNARIVTLALILKYRLVFAVPSELVGAIQDGLNGNATNGNSNFPHRSSCAWAAALIRSTRPMPSIDLELVLKAIQETLTAFAAKPQLLPLPLPSPVSVDAAVADAAVVDATSGDAAAKQKAVSEDDQKDALIKAVKALMEVVQSSFSTNEVLLASHLPELWTQIVSLLAKRDPALVRQALAGLSEIGRVFPSVLTPDSYEAIAACTKRLDPATRAQAFETLARVNELAPRSSADSNLLALLQTSGYADSQPSVREAAVLATRDFVTSHRASWSSSALSLLLELVKDHDAEVREAVLAALTQLLPASPDAVTNAHIQLVGHLMRHLNEAVKATAVAVMSLIIRCCPEGGRQ